jgi:hypothetical protein
MKNTVLTLLFTLSFYLVQAQTDYSDLKGELSGVEIELDDYKNSKYSAIHGSPYIDKKFKTAALILASGEVFNEVPVRLDIYKTIVEVKLNAEYFSVRVEGKVEEVRFSDGSIYKPIVDSEKLQSGFYHIHYHGELSVYEYEKVIFKAKEVGNTNYGGDKPDRFDRQKTKYIVEIDNEYYEVNSKSKFLKTMSVEQEDVYNTLKKRKLNPTKLKDLIDLAKAMDTSETALISD